MSNVLGNYNPEFFANEALGQLFATLGMAGRVHRDIETDRNTNGRSLGEVVNMRRPGKFEAKTHVPNVGSDRQNVEGQNVAIRLDQHQEVKFGLTDRELAYTSERIIQEHIRPAAFALGNKIDQDLHGLGSKIGPKATVAGTASGSFITGPRKVLRSNEVPMDNNIHYMIDSGLEEAFLNLGIFHEAQVTGAGGNTEALVNGSLGRRFGVEVFVSQNSDVSVGAMSSTATASAGSGDRVGALNAAVTVNDTSIVLKSLTGVETLQTGDTFTIASDPTTYVLTGSLTLSSGAGTLATFYPALRKSAPEDAVVTFNLLTAIEEAAHIRNLMFHRDAFALCFAALPSTGDNRGAQIATVMDEESGIALRARMWYNGDTATNMIALDALYGVQALDPMLATRVLRATSVYPS